MHIEYAFCVQQMKPFIWPICSVDTASSFVWKAWMFLSEMMAHCIDFRFVRLCECVCVCVMYRRD